MGQNESIIRDAYARYANGDLQKALQVFADDVIWRSSGAPNRISTAGERHGIGGVISYFSALLGEWKIVTYDLLEMLNQDDQRFVARVALELRHNITGSRVRVEKVDLLTMNNGKCTSFEEIFDAAPMERAARVR